MYLWRVYICVSQAQQAKKAKKQEAAKKAEEERAAGQLGDGKDSVRLTVTGQQANAEMQQFPDA